MLDISYIFRLFDLSTFTSHISSPFLSSLPQTRHNQILVEYQYHFQSILFFEMELR
ncbi:unnamed protein product [Periconia digitata]|uniref:Uncharacterized protein n=1 Tax=Periconia digitata TaxID=1303443 RepID=A0A9W4XTP0_9PLEO|nr:unnamed protein product [Periconia digitata]